MKRLVLIITMLVLTGAFNYVFSQDEDYYKNSFEKRISELDPIEGIYSVYEIHDVTDNGIPVSILLQINKRNIFTLYHMCGF